jgi:hypothetical protein
MWGLRLLHRVKGIASDAGSVAILAAFSLPVLLGLTGVAAETAVWFELKRRAQNAADSAAVAGAIQRARGDTTNVLKSATRAATQNGFTNGVSDTTVSINHPPSSGAYAGQQDAVEAIVTRQFSPLISKLFRNGNITIYARAVAEVKVVGTACVLSLNPTATNALYFQGSTIVDNSGCVVASNSTANNSVTMSGNSTLSAQSVWSAGGFNTPNDISQLTLAQPAKTNMWALDDPYAGVNIPTLLPPCQGAPSIPSNTPTSIAPGRFCGVNLAFGSQSIVSMQAGTYYIDSYGGTTKFDVRAGAQLSGSGVTIVLMDSLAPTTPATIEINGGAQVNLSAASSGNFNGILIYQDRAATNLTQTNLLNGGADMSLTGAVYIPNQKIKFNGDNSSVVNGCVILVANTLEFNGNSIISNTGCDETGVTPVEVKGVRLRE